MERVVSQRMSTSGSLRAVLRGTHWGRAAVLAGKRWLGQAQTRGAAQDPRAAHSLRRQIGELSDMFQGQACSLASSLGLHWLARMLPLRSAGRLGKLVARTTACFCCAECWL